MTKNKHIGGALLWVIISQQGLYHAMQRLGIYERIPSKRKESEPNE